MLDLHVEPEPVQKQGLQSHNESSDGWIIKWTVTCELAVALPILCFVLFTFLFICYFSACRVGHSLMI